MTEPVSPFGLWNSRVENPVDGVEKLPRYLTPRSKLFLGQCAFRSSRVLCFNSTYEPLGS